MKHRYVALLAGAALTIVKEPATGQTLARRIDGSAAAAVQFHFASRPPICGDGRAYMRVSSDGWISGSWDSMRSLPCERGPVRVVLARAGGETIRIETFAGPLAVDSTAADLGAVGSAEAAAYLMSIATGGEGRVARDALTGAALADSADISKGLMAIARDQSRARELRRGALGWLVRQAGERRGVTAEEMVATVAAIARDESESNATRQHAVGLLARFERGEGIPTLVAMAGQGADLWLAKQSTEVLSRNGDPRARKALRDLASNAAAPGEVRVAAFSGLAGEYGTAADAELIRKAYPSLASDRGRDAALAAVASVGGPSARGWLASVARDRDQAMRQRRHAAELLGRAGASSADLAKLYDQIDETDIRTTLVEQLAQAGTRDATTKLLAIARGEPNLAVRRKAVGALGRSDDPRVREALQGVVERP